MSRIIFVISADDGNHQLPLPNLGAFNDIDAAQFAARYKGDCSPVALSKKVQLAKL